MKATRDNVQVNRQMGGVLPMLEFRVFNRIKLSAGFRSCVHTHTLDTNDDDNNDKRSWVRPCINIGQVPLEILQI